MNRLAEAVNSADFDIIGVDAQNLERRLKLRLSEIDCDEPRLPKPIPNLKEAKKGVWLIQGSQESNPYSKIDEHYNKKASTKSEA